jgi:hypothetical protein
MSDIERARKAKIRAVRLAARERWLGRLSYSIAVTWQGGALGWLCGAVLMLAPVGLLALATWIGTRLQRGDGPDSDTGGAA